MNEIPTQDGRPIKWWMAVAYALSPGMAARLVEAVEAATNKSLRSPDIWLNRFATHCVWPPCFGNQGGPSQCMGSAEACDLYCDRRMLRRARLDPRICVFLR